MSRHQGKMNTAQEVSATKKWTRKMGSPRCGRKLKIERDLGHSPGHDWAAHFLLSIVAIAIVTLEHVSTRPYPCTAV